MQWSVYQAALDPIRGSEHGGLRPVLVVSREATNRSLPIVAVLPITSLKPGRRIYPTEVFLPAGAAGLPADSLAMAHQLRVIASERLEKKYGSVDDAALRRQVQEVMRLYLDLD